MLPWNISCVERKNNRNLYFYMLYTVLQCNSMTVDTFSNILTTVQHSRQWWVLLGSAPFDCLWGPRYFLKKKYSSLKRLHYTWKKRSIAVNGIHFFGSKFQKRGVFLLLSIAAIKYSEGRCFAKLRYMCLLGVISTVDWEANHSPVCFHWSVCQLIKIVYNIQSYTSVTEV